MRFNPSTVPHFTTVLTSASDLVTSYEATRAGFIRLALEKNRVSTPYVNAARALQAACRGVRSAHELRTKQEIRSGLLAASGLSDKALNRLRLEDHDAAIDELIRNFLEPAGTDFVEELVFRYLLNRGDSVGGSMRNIAGALAQNRLTRSLISTLAVAGVGFEWSDSTLKTWKRGDPNDVDIDSRARGLFWQTEKGDRTLIFNLSVPIVRKNVDLCLFDSIPRPTHRDIYRLTDKYIALGELKGGIDPAGADEHWKTARSALDRIRSGFAEEGHHPMIFFVAAAIESSMADEIWAELQSGELHFAANLNVDEQVLTLTRWLCSL